MRLAAPLLCALALAGCEDRWQTPERPGPFREEPYGAGLETGSAGRRVDVVDGDGQLVARYRVSTSGLRVYGPDAAQLGAVRPAPAGWTVVDVAGDEVCAMDIRESGVALTCDALEVTALRDEGGWSIHADERRVARVHELASEGWGLTYGDDIAPTVRWEDGQLSVQTHADARTWLHTDPLEWNPVVLVVSRLDLGDVDEGRLALIRGGLAFGFARTLDARPELGGYSD